MSLRARAASVVVALVTLAQACSRQPRMGAPSARHAADAGAPAGGRRGSWSDGPLFQVARGGHTATLLPDGRVLLVGGNANLHVTEHQGAESFDPAGQRDGTLYDLPLRVGHSTTRLADGSVLILGGREGAVTAAATLLLDGQVMAPSELPWRAPGHSATRLETDELLLLSGALGPATSLLISSRRGVISELSEWQPADHTATAVGRGQVLVVGERSETVGIFQPRGATLGSPRPHFSKEHWTPLPGAPGRIGHHVIVLLDGRALIFAGCEPSGCARPVAAQLFDPRTRRFTASQSPGPALVGAIAVRLLDGRVLIAGGMRVGDATFTPRAEAELYDPASDRWSPAAPMREARTGAAAVLLPDGRVLVTGGQVTGGGMDPFVRSTELFTP